MPGYGISVAGTTLIGQSIGANRKRLAGRFGYLVVGLGMAVMAGTGILLYVLAPWMMQILTPVEEVQKLGVICLRIEALAEPLFGAAIVSGGVFRGTGNTLKPSLINLCTMWLIRIPIAAYLATRVGLKGVWIAMCVDLMTRGAIFLVMLVLWNRKMRRESEDAA
jgi:Na+-driven multidrug efflux pump